MQFRVFAALALLNCVHLLCAEEPPKIAPKGTSVSVKVVDEQGNAVGGADVGTMAALGKFYVDRATKEGTEWLYVNHKRSDASGVAVIDDAAEWLGHLCVVIRHEGRKIAAAVNIDPTTAKESPVVVTLRPERKIIGKVNCPELPEPRSNLRWLVVYVLQDGKRVLETQWNDGKFEIPLPPGNYTLSAYGADTHEATPAFTLTPGTDAQQLTPITVKAKRSALLEGKRSPAIPGVVAWKNSPPLTMDDLRGKCVLLEFWGYWCGPCVYRMPKTFELYDKYHAQGLEVIGVHVDLGEDEQQPVATVAELDKRLEETKRDLWKGRDLPFPVALVIGKRTSYGEGIEQQARSPASAAFGVTSYPTHILIDRQGNVVGQFAANEEGLKLLEQKLAEP